MYMALQASNKYNKEAQQATHVVEPLQIRNIWIFNALTHLTQPDKLKHCQYSQHPTHMHRTGYLK